MQMIAKLLPVIGICLVVFLTRQLDQLYFSNGINSNLLYLEAIFSVVAFTSVSAVIWCLSQLWGWRSQILWWALAYIATAVCMWFFWYQPENVFGMDKSLLQFALCVVVMPVLAATACFVETYAKANWAFFFATVVQVSYAILKGMMSDLGIALTVNFIVMSMILIMAFYIPAILRIKWSMR